MLAMFVLSSIALWRVSSSCSGRVASLKTQLSALQRVGAAGAPFVGRVGAQLTRTDAAFQERRRTAAILASRPDADAVTSSVRECASCALRAGVC